MAHGIQARPHHLWLAAEGIGILHLGVAFQMRRADFTAFQKLAIAAGKLHLPLMWAQRMDAWIKRRVRTLDGIGRHRPGNDSRLHNALRFDKRVQGDGG